jgi:hypothetical protein
VYIKDMMNKLRNPILGWLPLVALVLSLLLGSLQGLKESGSGVQSSEKAKHSCCVKATSSPQQVAHADFTQSEPQNCCKDRSVCGGASPCCKVLYDQTQLVLYTPSGHAESWVDSNLGLLQDPAFDFFKPPRA